MRNKLTLSIACGVTLLALLVAALPASTEMKKKPSAAPKAQANTLPDSKPTSAPNPFNPGNSPDFQKLPTYIKADSLALHQQERNFVYTGNVEVKHGDMTITSDTLEGNYDQQNKIQKLTAKTNVLILKGDAIRGTSELAVYQAAQDVVTLTENPELSQNGSVLTADAIKIFLKDNRSEASGQVRVKMIDKKLGDSILGQGKAGL